MNLKEAVHDKIKELNPTIAELVITKLEEETIQKRVMLVWSVMTELDNLDKELRKFKPDVKTVSEDGVESGVYSKDTYEKKKKVSERAEKLKRILETALEDPSKYSELSSFVGQQEGTSSKSAFNESKSELVKFNEKV